jgi:Ca-activated chloride channel family protein
MSHKGTKARRWVVLSMMIASLCLCVFAVHLTAQEPYTLKVDVPVVSVDVAVSDAKGLLVNHLTRTDFQIYEDGTSQEIRFFSPVSAPYNVLLLFDRSGSTRNQWPFMQSAVSKFMENLRPQDKIALASFDDKFDMHLRWTTDRAKAIAALDELVKPRPVNGTRLYAALERSLTKEFKDVVGRRAVVVLTDGQDTSFFLEYDREFKNAAKAARERRIPVYFVALENEANAFVILPTTRKYLAGVRANMELLSESSGGQVLFPKTLEDVMPLYDQIGRALGTSYSLGYIPSTPPSDRAFRRIEVRTRTSGLRLTQSRSGYVGR